MHKKDHFFILSFALWVVALFATAGSLFFSEVMEFIPCTLCWYQRICMYPLVFISFISVLQFDRNILKYMFPLTSIGWAISLFHYLIQLEIIPASASPCRSGIPCEAKYINWAGFISIPFLSFMAFTLILTLLIIIQRKLSK